MEKRSDYRTTKKNEVLLEVEKALRNLKYGEIIIRVQAGEVTVIDRVDRTRIN